MNLEFVLLYGEGSEDAVNRKHVITYMEVLDVDVVEPPNNSCFLEW